MAEFIRTLGSLELVGGALCLDFANTVNSRSAPEHDYLMQYADVLEWTHKVDILSRAQTHQLIKQGDENADAAEEVLSTARSFRELLYRLFSNVAKGSEPNKQDMEAFVAAYGEAVSHGQLKKEGNHYKTTWKVDETLNAILWPIVHSAGELLLSEELTQVKECPSCGWLFLDISKNQSRRWCSMNTCGARDKMRRYYGRRRSQ